MNLFECQFWEFVSLVLNKWKFFQSWLVKESNIYSLSKAATVRDLGKDVSNKGEGSLVCSLVHLSYLNVTLSPTSRRPGWTI